jgi:sugar lactone lactonase YvrE
VCLLCAPFAAWAAPPSIALPGDRAFPENIASTRDGTLYVGSLGAGGVFRISGQRPPPEMWIKPGAFGSRSIFGVLADERSNTLWVCSNDLSAVGVAGPSTESGSNLKGFDLKTGAGKLSAALPGEHRLCNDIAVGPDGSVFVTNTDAPQILRLPPGGKQLEVWLSDPSLQPPSGGGLDGIAFGSDGNLYVDTFGPGELYRIDVHGGLAGKVTKLHPSRPLQRTDALRLLSKNRFLLVEGVGRVDRIAIHGDEVKVETLKDGFEVPTAATAIGRTVWVAEGQLSYVFDPQKRNQQPKLPFRIYAFRLPYR